MQAGDILHPQLDEYGGLRPIVVPVGIDQDPHLRLTRGLASKTNWFNVSDAKMGLQVGVSIQEDNASIMGVEASGRANKEKQKEVFSRIVGAIQGLGFSDIISNPKHGTVNIPSATSRDKGPIKMALLSLERSMGGMGLLPLQSYHRFAVGMTGDKMSSSKPKTTLSSLMISLQLRRRLRNHFLEDKPLSRSTGDWVVTLTKMWLTNT